MDYLCLLTPGGEVRGVRDESLFLAGDPGAAEASLGAMALIPDAKGLSVAHDGEEGETPAVSVQRLGAAKRRGRAAAREVPLGDGSPTVLAVSPDAKRFAGGTDGGAVRVFAVAFDPSGATLMTGGADGTVRVPRLGRVRVAGGGAVRLAGRGGALRRVLPRRPHGRRGRGEEPSGAVGHRRVTARSAVTER